MYPVDVTFRCWRQVPFSTHSKVVFASNPQIIGLLPSSLNFQLGQFQTDSESLRVQYRPCLLYLTQNNLED